MKIAVFWFRRDLRFDDNHGLMMALKSGLPVVPLFIFDENILRELPKNDARISFISEQLLKLDKKLRNSGSSLLIRYGQPFEIWQQLISRFEIASVFVNHDYEPYSLGRDSQVARLLRENGIDFQTFKDQVIFEKNEVLKSDGSPYTIFTPYKNKWLEKFQLEKNAQSYKTSELTGNFAKIN
jgi:deoxyribodipyrimidine photo-lyase